MSFIKTISLTSALAFFSVSVPASAQNVDQVRKQIEQLDAEEAKERKKLQAQLNKKRLKAIAQLDKLIGLYERRRDETSVDALRKQRELIVKRMGEAGKDLDKALAENGGDDSDTSTKDNTKPKEIVKWDQPYRFSDDSKELEGEFKFKADNQVEFNYFKSGKKVTEKWTWDDKGDHLYVKGDAEFGPIYISVVPDTEQKSIIVRWGGKLLKHRTSKATIK